MSEVFIGIKCGNTSMYPAGFDFHCEPSPVEEGKILLKNGMYILNVYDSEEEAQGVIEKINEARVDILAGSSNLKKGCMCVSHPTIFVNGTDVTFEM